MCQMANDTHAMRRRFLRARRYDYKKAQQQFAATEAWRKEHGIDNLFKNFDADEMHSARRFYPRWTGRRDKVVTLLLTHVSAPD